jgi:cytochrome c556
VERKELSALNRTLVAATLLTVAAPVLGDPQETIDYRRHVMKTMGEQVAIIGMILEKKAPPDAFATHVKVLAVTATTAKKAFEPNVPGGAAKPEVWSNWPEFAKRLDALVAATDDLAKTAATGGVPAAGPKVKTALTCKSCHDTFRVPKN